ncbi:MAG: site-2 protease family protein [Thermoleophilia bacterium]|nr:site-2 protease family protein [Thermoleophilia bacterium]
MDIQENLRIATFGIPLTLLAFALHEMAHAYAATFFGDPTPAQHGRRTLNPIKHLDPVGSLMIVGSLILFGFPFGFAVTPVNDSKMRRPRLHGALTAFAGPATNIVLCGFSMAALVAVLPHLGPDSFYLGNARNPLWFEVFYFGMVFNAFLAVFNLLPIPPLDGGRIVGAFMKPELAREWAKVGEYGIFIILGLVFLGGDSFSSFLGSLQNGLLSVVGKVVSTSGFGVG